MKNLGKTVFVSAAAMVAMFAANAASAQSFSPTSGTFNISSTNMSLRQSISLGCDLSGSGSITSGSTGHISSANFSRFLTLCGLLTENTPWSLEPIYYAGDPALKGIRISISLDATAGTCIGTLDGIYTPHAAPAKTGTLHIPYQQVNGSNSPACFAGGDILITPTGTSGQVNIL